MRDTHGFATKIYTPCGNEDFVGNHVSSFFINDGASFPDPIHAVKYEADKGFPTGYLLLFHGIPIQFLVPFNGY